MSADLIFEEPPPIRRTRNVGKSPFGLWLASLRDHPGQWAKYPAPRSPGDATFVRQGTQYGVEGGAYEVRSTNVDGPGKVWIYARYVGGES